MFMYAYVSPSAVLLELHIRVCVDYFSFEKICTGVITPNSQVKEFI